MTTLRDDVKDLIEDFAAYLTGKGLAAGTNRLYRGLISSMLNKHRVDPTDQVAVHTYYADLAVRTPAQAGLFRVAWGRFREYGVDVHGQVFVELPVEGLRKKAFGIPEAAVYDLHIALLRTPLTQLRQLRWRDIGRQQSDAHMTITTHDLKTGRPTGNLVKLAAALPPLIVLQKWAYGDVHPLPEDFVLPAFVGAKEPLPQRMLTRAIEDEQNRRALAGRAATPAVEATSTGAPALRLLLPLPPAPAPVVPVAPAPATAPVFEPTLADQSSPKMATPVASTFTAAPPSLPPLPPPGPRPADPVLRLREMSRATFEGWYRPKPSEIEELKAVWLPWREADDDDPSGGMDELRKSGPPPANALEPLPPSEMAKALAARRAAASPPSEEVFTVDDSLSPDGN